MYASAPVPDDFSLSRGVNACLTRLHELLAMLERPPDLESELLVVALDSGLERTDGDANARLAYHLTGFKAHAGENGTTALDASLVRQRAGPGGACSAEQLRWQVVHRVESTGSDSIQVRAVSAEPSADCAVFVDTWSHHRASLFAYRWLWAWESVGDGEVFRELLEGDEFEGRLSPGVVVRSVADFILAARSLDVGLRETHHVLRSVRIAVGPDRYAVSADVSWQGRDVAGQALRARTLHEWELFETGERYPRLRRLKTVTSEASRDEPPSRDGSLFANEPSDDAEAGGA